MPFAYAFDDDRQLTYCRIWGGVTLAEFMELRQALRRDPNFDPSHDVILDLRDATGSPLAPKDIEALANMQSAVASQTRRVFVTANHVQFGLARMFEIRQELSTGREPVRVCPSLEEALTYLGKPDYVPPDFGDLKT